MGEKEGELKTEPQSNERLRFKGGVTCKNAVLHIQYITFYTYMNVPYWSKYKIIYFLEDTFGKVRIIFRGFTITYDMFFWGGLLHYGLSVALMLQGHHL